jgi:multidrug efflux system membrane fusion protein
MQNGKIVPKLLLLVSLAGAASWWYWSHANATTSSSAEAPNGSESGKKHRGSGDNKPVPVLVASVQKGNIRVVQSAVGTVVPSAMVTVSSRVNGQLTRILFKEGQLVRAGELLAELDPRPFQAALAQVQGQALRDQALLHNSQIDLERYKTLQGQDSIAYQQVDAQASLVQQYQGTVQADQGLVDNAKLQLSFTRITSPINGRIGLRQVDMGNNITTANVLAVINAVDPIHVVFTLPEDRVSDLVHHFQEAKKSGKNLPVEAWDRSNTKSLAKGNLLSLDNQIDTTSGTVKLKAQFSNKESALFPNQFVNVRLLSDTLRDVAVVPNAAIQHGSAGTFVYLITQDQKGTKVTVQTVKLGTVDGDNVAVLDGLKTDDLVVISGIDKLRENAKVKISSAENKTGKGRHGKHEKSASKSDDKSASDVKTPRPEGGWKHRNAEQSGSSTNSQAATAQ